MVGELIILCEACGKKNRINSGQSDLRPKCGNCGNFLTIPNTSSSGIRLILVIAFIAYIGYWTFQDKPNQVKRQVRPTVKTSPPSFNAPPVNIKTGVVRALAGRQAVAKLNIKTRAGSDYLIKLVSLATNVEELVIYIVGGQSFSVDVSLGNYVVRYASRKTWYGEEHLFGPKTAFAKADKNFIFKREGNQILGYTIELIPQISGNLRTSKIGRSQF